LSTAADEYLGDSSVEATLTLIRS
jgi:hypothetical protein